MTDDLSVLKRLAEKWKGDVIHVSADAVAKVIARVEKAEARVRELEEENDVLRSWGNKDCTKMADAELERRRTALGDTND